MHLRLVRSAHTHGVVLLGVFYGFLSIMLDGMDVAVDTLDEAYSVYVSKFDVAVFS